MARERQFTTSSIALSACENRLNADRTIWRSLAGFEAGGKEGSLLGADSLLEWIVAVAEERHPSQNTMTTCEGAPFSKQAFKRPDQARLRACSGAGHVSRVTALI
jgi:hypothetical protein